MAMALAAPAFADDKPLILVSVPGMNFPFFVHMMKAFKAEAAKQGLDTIEGDGQNVLAQADRRHRGGADQGRQGHRDQPDRRRRDGAGAARGDRRQGAGRHRRPAGALGDRHPRPCRRRQRQGRRGAGQPDRQDVPERSDDRQPAGSARREPGDRPQQGPAQRARQGGRQIQDRVRADRALSTRQGPFGHRIDARGHGDAAAGHRRRQRRHGARRDRGGQGAQPQGRRHHRLRRPARGAGESARRRDDRDDRAVPRQAERLGGCRSWPTISRAARSRISRSICSRLRRSPRTISRTPNDSTKSSDPQRSRGRADGGASLAKVAAPASESS